MRHKYVINETGSKQALKNTPDFKATKTVAYNEASIF